MKKVLVLVLAALIWTGVANAQGLKIGLTGGLTKLMAPDEYKNDIVIDPVSGEIQNLGFQSNYHIGAKAKFSLPLLPLKITGQFVYSSFSGEAEIQASKIPWSSSATKYSVETSMNMTTLALGAEYKLIPGPLAPYLAAELQLNSLGDMKYKINGIETSGKGESRTGLGLGAGIELTLLPVFDIDLSAKYSMVNMMGKKSGEEKFNTLNLTATLYYSIF